MEDIMMEAYEAHAIELSSKMIHKNQFINELEMKLEKWNELFSGKENALEDSRKKNAFLLHEVSYLYDPFVTANKPFLENFIKNAHKRESIRTATKEIEDAILKFTEFEAHLQNQSVGLFKGKQGLRNCLTLSKELVNNTKAINEKIRLYKDGRLNVNEEWSHIEEKTQELVQKNENQLSLSKEEADWLRHTAMNSIMYQYEMGCSFFTHHFAQVEQEIGLNGKLKKRIAVYESLHKAILNISKRNDSDVPHLLKWGFLDSLTQEMQVAKRNCYWDYRELRRELNIIKTD